MKAARYSVNPFDTQTGVVREVEERPPMPKVVELTIGMLEQRDGQWRAPNLAEIRDCMDAIWNRLLSESTL